jgi:ATP-dependent DNA helicase RecG
LPEHQNIEWKPVWNTDWLKWVCGFANAQGGTLYIGADDNGNILGIKKPEKLLKDIPNTIKNSLGIICDVNLLTKDDDQYIEIVTAAYSVPINYKGKYYYRSGGTNLLLEGIELERFLNSRHGRTWDMTPVPGITLADLDSSAIKLFRKKARERKRLTDEELDVSDEILLRNLRLYEGDKLTRAAVMMFHEDPERFANGAYIKIGYFGRSDADLQYQDEVHGPLVAQVDKAIDLIYTKYLKYFISYDDIQRVETAMFSREAMRELVLNAVQHKQNERNIPIQISVYPDQMYIYNIGELPQELPPERLFVKHSSMPRNPNIANTFFKTGMVEGWGRGYEKIIEACKEHGDKLPKVKAEQGGVMVHITESNKYRELRLGYEGSDEQSILDNFMDTSGSKTVHDNVHDNANGKVSKNSQYGKLLTRLVYVPHSTFAELANATGLHQKTVQRRVKELQEMGKLVREGSDRKGTWVIIDG